MREICAVVVALLVFGGSSPAAQGDADLKDTDLADTLWQIAVATHTRVGFQSIGRTPWWTHLKRSIDPEPLDVSRAVDAAVAADVRYGWHMVGGTAVIRPREAWTDPGDPLNHRVPDVQLTNETPLSVLNGLSNLVFYNRFKPEHPANELPVSFQMKAGTVVDALNQLAEQAGQMMWTVYARPRDSPNGWDVCLVPGSCHADLIFQLRGAEHLSAGVATQPMAAKGQR
jgi:hypothetical protein